MLRVHQSWQHRFLRNLHKHWFPLILFPTSHTTLSRLLTFPIRNLCVVSISYLIVVDLGHYSAQHHVSLGLRFVMLKLVLVQTQSNVAGIGGLIDSHQQATCLHRYMEYLIAYLRSFPQRKFSSTACPAPGVRFRRHPSPSHCLGEEPQCPQH